MSFAFGAFTTASLSQSPGNGHECSNYRNEDCNQNPPWVEPSAPYDVTCCCTDPDEDSATIVCTCSIVMYQHNSYNGSKCYNTSCYSYSETPCEPGQSLGNVYWATEDSEATR